MVKSMTGFGRGEVVTEESRVTVEMKAVNHRYCDISIRMPRKLNALEIGIRGYLKKRISRGKIDVFISYEDLSDRAAAVKLNSGLASGYYEALKELSRELSLEEAVTPYQIGRFPEVITVEDLPVNEEQLEEVVYKAVEEACRKFQESRSREGENLKEDILSKLEAMKENVAIVEQRYPDMVSDYRRKLEEKVHNLLEDTTIDESRVATEVVIYADKISVDEETVRLRSHIDAMKEELIRGGNIGRKLDFIAQEMNREANTILSKANDLTISGHAIEFKTDIEKIREQVQNIE